MGVCWGDSASPFSLSLRFISSFENITTKSTYNPRRSWRSHIQHHCLMPILRAMPRRLMVRIIIARYTRCRADTGGPRTIGSQANASTDLRRRGRATGSYRSTLFQSSAHIVPSLPNDATLADRYRVEQPLYSSKRDDGPPPVPRQRKVPLPPG